MQVLSFVAHAITTFEEVKKHYAGVTHPSQANMIADHGHKMLLGASQDFSDFQEDSQEEVPLTKEQKYEKYLENLQMNMEFAHAAWKGWYSGLYGKETKYQAPKPTDDCFGDWIVDHIREIHGMKHNVFEDFWHTDLKQYEQGWYNIGDLMFRNEDECHFRAVTTDIFKYCGQELNEKGTAPACSSVSVAANMQKNMFNLITQTSSIAAMFQADDWEQMEQEDRVYAYQTLGKTSGQIYRDVTGFHPVRDE